MARIGVFGGSFDPIHIGHLIASVNVLHELKLDRVLLVVANEPWQKVGTREVAAAELRYRLVEAAVEGHDGLVASRIEIDRGGSSYTADTLRAIKQTESDVQLFLIVGADTAAGIETWNRWRDVAELAELVIVNRPGGVWTELSDAWKVTQITIPSLEVSSTDLRARIADGRPLDFLIPEAALNLMRSEGFYPGVQKS